MLRGTCFVVVTIISSTLTTVPGLPFLSSLNQTLTMVFECFLWWMSHSDSVCTLCWELLSSESFFSRAASEKADILTRLRGGDGHRASPRCVLGHKLAYLCKVLSPGESETMRLPLCASVCAIWTQHSCLHMAGFEFSYEHFVNTIFARDLWCVHGRRNLKLQNEYSRDPVKLFTGFIIGQLYTTT